MELPYDPAIPPLIRKDMQPYADYILFIIFGYFGHILAYGSNPSAHQ